MTQLNRRRFLTIAAAGLLAPRALHAAPLQRWRGIALGAEATILLAHPDGAGIAEAAFREIARLEKIFSLYRPESEVSRLNRDGVLSGPSFELIECLSLSAALHRATDGLFDPTVQPLWQLYAATYSAGRPPADAAIAEVLSRTGFAQLRFDGDSVAFAQPHMALTLNGIAQGYIADKVADRLRREGLKDLLVDCGEVSALGSGPDTAGQGWPLSFRAGEDRLPGKLFLRDRALASSAPLGTAFDDAGEAGHIIDPRDGTTAPAKWRLVSVSAPLAAVADGLSTAGCLLSKDRFETAVAAFPGAKIERLL